MSIHSECPEIQAEVLAEMFARRETEVWKSGGNEVWPT